MSTDWFEMVSVNPCDRKCTVGYLTYTLVCLGATFAGRTTPDCLSGSTDTFYTTSERSALLSTTLTFCMF